MAVTFFRRCTILMALVLVGCGETTSGVDVQGRVTYAGNAVSEGSLIFYPTAGRPTTVTLAADGTYDSRLAAGDYRVTVAVGVQLPAGWKEGDPVPPPTLRLPPAYGSRVRTPLKVTISENRNEPLDFTLQ